MRTPTWMPERAWPAGRRPLPLDLESNLPGPETTVTTYAGGCRSGTRVELRSIEDGDHVPALTAGFAPAVIDFLLARVSP